MPDGGTLDIETQIEKGATRSGFVAVIRVSDTGTGMPSEVAARALDPTFATKKQGISAGWGLRSCAGFIRQCGAACGFPAGLGREPRSSSSCRTRFLDLRAACAACERARDLTPTAGGFVMRIVSSALLAVLMLSSPALAFELTSPDVADGQSMSKSQVYPRCGGDNVSPALQWSGAPQATRSFVLTMIDQDVAPSQWSHWIVVNLPANTTALAHNDSLPAGAHGVVSNFGDASYDGPCPPIRTGLHHYRITIWAMPTATVSVPANANARDLAAQLSHQAIGSASLTGTYRR